MTRAKFIVNETFQYGAGVKRTDEIIELSVDLVKIAMAKGKITRIDKKTGKTTEKWASGLLNHCSPIDDFTAELVGKEKVELEASETEEAERVALIKKELTALDVPYDGRWKLKKLETELIRAKKERGL